METFKQKEGVTERYLGQKILTEVLNITHHSKNSLGKAIGLKRSQALYDIEDGTTKNISAEIADKIAKAFTFFSKEWLLTGEGPVFKNIQQMPEINNAEYLYLLAAADVAFANIAEIKSGQSGRPPAEHVEELRKNANLRLRELSIELKKGS